MLPKYRTGFGCSATQQVRSTRARPLGIGAVVPAHPMTGQFGLSSLSTHSPQIFGRTLAEAVCRIAGAVRQ
jgi:hypothetical protein